MVDPRALERIKKSLSDHLAHASGRAVMAHGVKQWDVVADALVEAIIEIVKGELQGPNVVELNRD